MIENVSRHFSKSKKIRVALLIDEFFGGAGTAYGGYGFLARKFIAKYIPDEDLMYYWVKEKKKADYHPFSH